MPWKASWNSWHWHRGGSGPCSVAVYVVLHRVAAREVVVVTQSGQVATAVMQAMWKTAASIGQYAVPLLCFAGAGISAWRRRERRTLVSDVTRSDAAGALDGMSWRQFERLHGAGVSAVFEVDGAADGQARHQPRCDVLGLYRLPGDCRGTRSIS